MADLKASLSDALPAPSLGPPLADESALFTPNHTITIVAKERNMRSPIA